MNQRTLKVLTVTTGARFTGALATGSSFDLAQDNTTTNAWTFANIGRREMKLSGYFVNAFTGTSNCTAATGWLIGSTTGAIAGTWAPIANSTFGGTVTNDASNFTTGGGFFPIAETHFSTNLRYVRPVLNVEGATTASVSLALFVLEEQRAS